MIGSDLVAPKHDQDDAEPHEEESDDGRGEHQLVPSKVVPAKTRARYAEKELDPAKQEEGEQHDGVTIVAPLVELRVSGRAVVCDGPSTPPTSPVVGKIAQGRLSANPNRTVAALYGALDTPR